MPQGKAALAAGPVEAIGIVPWPDTGLLDSLVAEIAPTRGNGRPHVLESAAQAEVLGSGRTTHGSRMVAERMLMSLLLVGIAVGCWFVLTPFLSAILWAGILVFSTWPVFEWVRSRLRLRRAWAAGAMVSLTAVLIVLPLALAAPAGAEDANQLRAAIEALLGGGLPASPAWLAEVPAPRSRPCGTPGQPT